MCGGWGGGGGGGEYLKEHDFRKREFGIANPPQRGKSVALCMIFKKFLAYFMPRRRGRVYYPHYLTPHPPPPLFAIGIPCSRIREPPVAPFFIEYSYLRLVVANSGRIFLPFFVSYACQIERLKERKKSKHSSFIYNKIQTKIKTVNVKRFFYPF